ncbi:hypothetical protein A3Q56_08108 [Intoshia linei]|uniref:Nuclear transcription factor Y subunit n=1 Tax=Intoshia linei TaxID=1819745 RepID=A0A177AQA8_9BILA|nr:hypothetical protein A3Q56_08108 [Intoshia linei]
MKMEENKSFKVKPKKNNIVGGSVCNSTSINSPTTPKNQINQAPVICQPQFYSMSDAANAQCQFLSNPNIAKQFMAMLPTMSNVPFSPQNVKIENNAIKTIPVQNQEMAHINQFSSQQIQNNIGVNSTQTPSPNQQYIQLPNGQIVPTFQGMVGNQPLIMMIPPNHNMDMIHHNGSTPTQQNTTRTHNDIFPQPIAVSNKVQDDEPLYVNNKQYDRILKRREARAKLEKAGRIPRERKRLQCRLHLHGGIILSIFHV